MAEGVSESLLKKFNSKLEVVLSLLYLFVKVYTSKAQVVEWVAYLRLFLEAFSSLKVNLTNKLTFLAKSGV